MTRLELEELATRQGRAWTSDLSDVELEAMVQRPLWAAEAEESTMADKICLGRLWDGEDPQCTSCAQFYVCREALALRTIPQLQGGGRSLESISDELGIPMSAVTAALAAHVSAVEERKEEVVVETVKIPEASTSPAEKPKKPKKPKSGKPKKGKVVQKEAPKKEKKGSKPESPRHPSRAGSAKRALDPVSKKKKGKGSTAVPPAGAQAGQIRPWSKDTWMRRWTRERERNPWVGMLRPGEHVGFRKRSGLEDVLIVRQGYYQLKSRGDAKFSTLGACIMELEGGRVYQTKAGLWKKENNWSAHRYFPLMIYAREMGKIPIVEDLFKKLGKPMPEIPVRM